MFAIISSSDGDTEKSNLMQIDTPRTKEKEPEQDSFAEITQSSIVGTSDELPVSFLNDNDQVLPIIPLDSSLEAIEASIEAPVSYSLINPMGAKECCFYQLHSVVWKCSVKRRVEECCPSAFS